MCLNKLTVKRTLKKDKVVQKVMERNNGRIVTFFELYDFSKKRIHQAKVRTIYASDDKPLEYDSGFHCYPEKKKNPKGYDAFYENYDDCFIEDFIIPAGTTVQYGKQNNQTVIVTPVLINPRVKEGTL